MPQRIQMSRQRPWRAEHPDAVIVARGTRWGNPFRISADGNRDQVVQWFANWLTNTVDAEGRYVHGGTDYLGVESADRPSVAEIRTHLAGKDLACWCPLDHPCHADVLIRIANI